MSYSVKELYYTLQGEGAQSGRAAVFLRFAGCNLWSGLEKDRAGAVCRFCDTDFVGTDGPGGGKFANAAGLAFIVLGIAIIVIAGWRFVQTAKDIDSDNEVASPGERFDLALSGMIGFLIFCCVASGAAYLRNKSNRSITKPKAIIAIAVRTQARKVRSLAA